mgnify:CR=1 FL=1
MTRLSVTKVSGPYCATNEQGAQLFQELSPYFKADECVELDFSGVELTSSSFFNELFGAIAEAFGDTFSDQHLSFSSLKPRHRFVLDRTHPGAAA